MQKLKNFLKVHKEYYHILFLPVYLISFFIVEKVVPTEGYWVSYLPMDDKIPFVDWFVIFYALWYPLLVFTGVFALIKKEKGVFCRYMTMMWITFMGTLLFSLLFPNGQDLRPETFEKKNIFTWLIGRIYASDTNTNVLPSMHVLGCLSAIYASFDSKEYPWWSRVIIAALSVLICASTVLIKQHSILDLFVAVPVSLIVGGCVYGKRIASAVKEKTAQKIVASRGEEKVGPKDTALAESTENGDTSHKNENAFAENTLTYATEKYALSTAASGADSAENELTNTAENRPVTLPLYGGKPVGGDKITGRSGNFIPDKMSAAKTGCEAEFPLAESKIPSSAKEETAAEDAAE